MQSIFAKLLYEIEKRHDTVLVTIIRESGSTPRGEGAQMLVGAQGPLSGTIGGGNVENLSILHARDLIAQRCSDLHEYPLHRSDAEDIGMVCGGDVTALFTFIPGTDAAWAALAADPVTWPCPWMARLAFLRTIRKRKAPSPCLFP